MHVTLAERNLLIGGEPGSGKSVRLNLIVGHAALSPDCRLVLVDGKRVELGSWRECADAFMGPSIVDAIATLRRLQSMMDSRYDVLLDAGRRKITAETGLPVVLVVIDELAYFSSTVGDTKQQKEFVALLRDLVARGRAAGIIVVAAAHGRPTVCAHGRPTWCSRIHVDDDPRLGEPLCGDCYDYAGHAAFNWWAPELWRRFTITLRRVLTRRSGLPPAAFGQWSRVSFVKVAEFQRRAIVHLHGLIRLDGPDGFTPSALALGVADLADAIREAAAAVRLTVDLPGGPAVLGFGPQTDTQAIKRWTSR